MGHVACTKSFVHRGRSLCNSAGYSVRCPDADREPKRHAAGAGSPAANDQIIRETMLCFLATATRKLVRATSARVFRSLLLHACCSARAGLPRWLRCWPCRAGMGCGSCALVSCSMYEWLGRTWRISQKNHGRTDRVFEVKARKLAKMAEPADKVIQHDTNSRTRLSS